MAAFLALGAVADAQVIQFPDTSPATGGTNQIPRAFQVPTHAGLYVREMFPGDVDGDADQDLFLIGDSGLKLYVNGVPDSAAGNVVESIPSPAYGTFTDWTVVPGTNAERVDQVTTHASDGFTADMDRDGDLDLVVCTTAAGGGNVWMLMNTRLSPPSGGVAPVGPLRFTDCTKPAHGWTIPPPPAQALMHGIAPADVDGDGDVDFVVGTTDLSDANGTVELYRNNWPTRSFTRTTIAGPFVGGVRDVALRQFNGDAVPDVACAVSNGPNQVVLSVGAAFVAVPLPTAIGNGSFGRAVAAGDVDGDGSIDIVIGHAPGFNAFGGDLVYRNTGAGFAVSGFLPKPAGKDTNDLELFDMDEDGDLDAVTVASFTNGTTATMLFSNAAGVFNPEPGRIMADTGVFSEAVTTADIDLDLDRDIVVAYWAQGQVNLFPNHLWQLDCDPIIPATGGPFTVDTYTRAGTAIQNGAAWTWVTLNQPARPFSPNGNGYLAIGPGWSEWSLLGHSNLAGTASTLYQLPPLPTGMTIYMQSILAYGSQLRASNITKTVIQ